MESKVTTPQKIMIGVDPEIAVRSLEQDRFVSAHGLVPGDKYTPHKVEEGQVLIDGTMLEYGITPCDNVNDFVRRNRTVISKLKEMIGPKYEMVFDQSVFFDKFYMDKLPDSVKELGCSADFDAWNDGVMNPPPNPTGPYVNMRACGGHIHISWTKDQDVESIHHKWDCVQVIRQLDTWVLPYLLLLEDKNDPRRLVYGGFGAFRPKPYGVEWRVPSNVWLRNEEVWSWLFNAVKHIVEKALAGDLPYIADGTRRDKRIALASEYINRLVCADKSHYYATYVSSSLGDPTFPQFPTGCLRKEPESKKTIAEGIRIAASATTVDYDVNLDWEVISSGSQNYSHVAPPRASLKIY